ncbi:unnamed protein product [Caenorhabditis nigoni]
MKKTLKSSKQLFIRKDNVRKIRSGFGSMENSGLLLYGTYRNFISVASSYPASHMEEIETEFRWVQVLKIGAKTSVVRFS